jgi:hypothetical protein
MSESEAKTIEIVAKPKKRDVTPGQLAKEIFIDINYNDPLQIPIKEVLDVLSADKNGFVKYSNLGEIAQSGRLRPSKSDKVGNTTFGNLKSAYAEAIVLKGFRGASKFKQVIYEPSKQSGTVAGGLALSNAPPEIYPAIVDSFGNKTPDMLLYSPLVERQSGNKRVIWHGSLDNIINPDNPQDVERLLEYNYPRQSLVALIEVTTSATSSRVSAS